MGLSGKLGNTPSLDDTLVTVTLGNSNDIDNLILLKDLSHSNLLLKVASGELDLVGNRSSVDLNLHQVCLLLRQADFAVLGVDEDSNGRSVLLDSLELSGDGSAVVLGVLLGISGESLLL